MSAAGVRAPAGALFIVLSALLTPGAARGADPPRVLPGAVEIGLAGSLVSVEGAVGSTLVVRCGSFFGAPRGLGGIEAELGYNHVRGFDAVDVEGAVSWQRAVSGSAVIPFVAMGGGVRQEWLGSFSQARYPVGFSLGLRVVAGARAAVRVEYRYRRLLSDPVADFSEHQALVGVSLLFRNAPRSYRGGEE